MMRMMMRLAMLLALSATPALAQPILDPSGGFIGGAKSTNSATVSLTSSLFPDLAYLVVNAVDHNSPPVTVTSVSGAGLTWVRRRPDQAPVITGTYAACFSGNTCYQTLDAWYATANATVSAQTITVAVSRSVDQILVGVFAVNGLASLSQPFDQNFTNPATAQNTTAVDNTQQISGLTYNNASQALTLCAEAQAVNQGPTECAPNTGPSGVFFHGACFTNGGCVTDYNWLTAARADAVATINPQAQGGNVTGHAWAMFVDAFSATPPPPPPPQGANVTPQIEVNE